MGGIDLQREVSYVETPQPWGGRSLTPTPPLPAHINSSALPPPPLVKTPPLYAFFRVGEFLRSTHLIGLQPRDTHVEGMQRAPQKKGAKEVKGVRKCVRP